MRWLAFVFLFLPAAPAALWAQEVIVFKDGRSLVVGSHREQGPWTYFRMEGGELAVHTSSIDQIRKEGAEAQQSAKAAAAATTSTPPPSPPSKSESPPAAKPAQPPPDSPVKEEPSEAKASPPSQPPGPSRAVQPGKGGPFRNPPDAQGGGSE